MISIFTAHTVHHLNIGEDLISHGTSFQLSFLFYNRICPLQSGGIHKLRQEITTEHLYYYLYQYSVCAEYNIIICIIASVHVLIIMHALHWLCLNRQLVSDTTCTVTMKCWLVEDLAEKVFNLHMARIATSLFNYWCSILGGSE